MSNQWRKRGWRLLLLLCLLAWSIAYQAPAYAAVSAENPTSRQTSFSKLEPALAERIAIATRGWHAPRLGGATPLLIQLASQTKISATALITPAASGAATECLDGYEDDGIAATAKSLVPGEVQAHLFCPAGDADWLSFSALAGQGYMISASGSPGSAEPYIYLFAPDGAILLSRSDDPAQQEHSALQFHPPTDGTFFVQLKNQGDAGSPNLSYQVQLHLITASPTPQPSSTPTNTPPATPSHTPTPSNTASSTPLAESASASALEIAVPVVTSATSQEGDPTSLLIPSEGGASSGGLPVFDAGPLDAMVPDLLEPNNSFSTALALDVGAVYQHLNFVPGVDEGADGDFYSFRAKPNLCYLVQTGDLSPGLDTTILLWRAGATREDRVLVAQNDDGLPRTADLSSRVRWCSPVDGFMVLELHNYGWVPQTDPRGKSYSLAVLIDPPTPTATPRPADRPATASGGAGSNPASASVATSNADLANAANTPTVVMPTNTPTITPTITPTSLPSSPTHPTAIATETAGDLAASGTPGDPSNTPAVSATATASATPVPTAVADLTCYLDLNGNEAPDPGEGIVGLRGVVIDGLTNAIIGEAKSDANGHIRLLWTGRESVRLALPDLGWNQELLPYQLQQDPNGSGASQSWSSDVRIKAPLLPGILP